ncbi:hypothetical protein PYK79_48500 [Streptomyces sp. ID05-04B]|uniref:hypothetical protein n=1 Tax=unclassified Streptomyces TaxID=2593676 RepID=UPI000D1B2466|nr:MULTISPECIES: hypothetical protein [unclassified Streptomyces]AVV44748.1 hypothetical protein C6376_28335 [Streptomyces sp. P3]MDX5569544.1 hypothetical protein [Streptomyces sp. ID05-04B]
MNAFLLGVLSSLATSALLLVLSRLHAARPLWWLTAACSWFNGTGLHRVYRRQASAERAMRQDLARAQWVKVIAGRGNVLTREAFAPLWSGTISPASVQILLPDPDTPHDSWLDRRSHNVARFDPGYTPDLLRSQVRANIDYLTQAAQTHTGLRLRRYNLPHTCRIIATDKVAYLTFYSDNAHGRNSPCLYARAPGLLYTIALQQFDTAWANSTEAPTPQHP